MNILGVRVDNLSQKEILAKVTTFLQGDSFHQIATVNPEFILGAQKDPAFKEAVNGADLCLADGVGIGFACLRFGKRLKARMTGVDLMEEILRLASINHQPVFLVASTEGLSSWEEARDAILRTHPSLQITGATLDPAAPPGEDSPIAGELLFCSFGAPRQELFIRSLKTQKNSRIRLAMGVGGGFDFLTRKVRRAPRFWRAIGLEWAWRFLQEPRYRAKRIFRSVVLFPIKIIFN